MQTALNRLAGERSPYLKSAAHQPVQWYPWTSEAFREAQHLDRPVLLAIGAVWCHWCHVFDRESYDNEELSRIINENFVAVKVDRDERPDIDSRYQTAVSALTGQGGWPLTAFLTPEGHVFYGGTYFPPEDRYGRPGFKRILKRIADLYRTRKPEVVDDSKKIAALFEKPKPAASAEIPGRDFITQCLDSLKHQFDFTHGGFGNAPKFFHPAALELLLDRYVSTQEKWVRSVIEKTLEAMGKGGVFDQLGGGFHRYSVDERWVVPHFEKMSYDNAALLKIYARAFEVFKKPFYREITEGILHWSREFLIDALRGGFYASQDADVNSHDDGDYYTWTLREVESLVTPEEAQALLPHFHIEAQGEMTHDPSRNVLHVAREPEFLARELELKPQEVIERIESAKQKLREARGKRRPPFVDQTLYSNWNGMWIQGYLAASRAFQDDRLKEFALKTLDRFLESGFQPGKGMGRFLSDGEPPEGLLEDQTEILAAALAGFDATREPRYLDFSKELARILIDRFGAPEGGFCDRSAVCEEGPLCFRERRIQDHPVLSPNARAALSFLTLHRLTQDPEYLTRVEALLRSFREEAQTLSFLASGYVSALNAYWGGAAG